jgi:hypothetical protein
MTIRRALVLSVLTWAFVACAPEGEVEAPSPGAPEAPVEAAKQPASIAGTYEMDGLTVERRSGQKRKISGTIVVAQDGARFTASLHLRTTYPTPDGPLDADVVGDSEGVVEGARLEGVARTQLVMAQVPGVDASFAFMPRWAGPRLVSKAVGELSADGILTLQTENEPAEGEQYAATRTTLRGARLADQDAAPQAHE